MLSPYIDEDEPNAIRDTPARRAASSTAAVPVTLACAYPTGSAIDGRTPARAARWAMTVSGVSKAWSALTSSMSCSWKRKPGSRPMSRRLRSFIPRA